jgi:hypothetical protein
MEHRQYLGEGFSSSRTNNPCSVETHLKFLNLIFQKHRCIICGVVRHVASMPQDARISHCHKSKFRFACPSFGPTVLDELMHAFAFKQQRAICVPASLRTGGARRRIRPNKCNVISFRCDGETVEPSVVIHIRRLRINSRGFNLNRQHLAMRTAATVDRQVDARLLPRGGNPYRISTSFWQRSLELICHNRFRPG